MGNMVFGVVWRLASGIECVLFRNHQAGLWLLEVRRDTAVLASESFLEVASALDVSNRWRTMFHVDVCDTV